MSFELPDDLSEVDFLLESDVLFIHDELALKTGGKHGMLKRNDLLGAIGRPEQAARYDTTADLILIAAYYWHGISVSHGFVDGNKRTGLISAIAFLYVNGIGFKADEHEPGNMVNEWMAQGEFTLDRLDAYLRERCYLLQESDKIEVKTAYDTEAKVWVACSDDVAGFAVEAETAKELMAKVDDALDDLGYELRNVNLVKVGIDEL